jgi:hypothetical protein
MTGSQAKIPVGEGESEGGYIGEEEQTRFDGVEGLLYTQASGSPPQDRQLPKPRLSVCMPLRQRRISLLALHRPSQFSTPPTAFPL